MTGDVFDSTTVRFHGASNLPAGAQLSIELGNYEGKPPSHQPPECVSVDEKGLFRGEFHAPKSASFHRGQVLDATFATYLCKQPSNVLGAVGKKGQFLGNDNYDNAHDVAIGWTEGMFNNPQLFQVSGWYFGLRAFAPVE